MCDNILTDMECRGLALTYFLEEDDEMRNKYPELEKYFLEKIAYMKMLDAPPSSLPS